MAKPLAKAVLEFWVLAGSFLAAGEASVLGIWQILEGVEAAGDESGRIPQSASVSERVQRPK